MLPLSIIIPTQNRAAQCIAAVRSVLACPNPFELIVFDSGDGDELAGLLRDVDDMRLQYVRTPAAMNMTQCFEEAVALGTGRYVCMIGDDDGVTPALFAWAERAAASGLSSVTVDPAYYVLYNWPDIKSPFFGTAASGKLFMRIGPNTVRTVDATELIGDFLDRAGQGCGTMPRVYHGLVARDVLQDIRQRYGRCFDGVSPDVSFSYLAALCSPNHAIIGTPLTISGTSAVSNAGRSAMLLHQGDLWSDPHMRNYQGEPWPDAVPEFFSVETVWGQATLSALDRAGCGDRRRFNFRHFYALLLLRHTDRWAETMRAAAVSGSTSHAGIAAATLLTGLRLGSGNAQKLWRKAFPDQKREVAACATLMDASVATAARIAG